MNTRRSNSGQRPRTSTSRRAHAGGGARKTTTQRASRQPAAKPTRRIAPLAAFLVALAAIGVVAGMATTALLGSSGSQPSQTDSSAAQGYVSPYDFSGLSKQGDRMAYEEAGVAKSQVGIDVSEMQGAIDWSAVASDDVRFAFVRAGYRGTSEGGLFADARFGENLNGAATAGLQTGVYFYSQATSVAEAEEEADFVLGMLNGRSLDLPVVFDHEKDTTVNARGNDVDRDTLTAAALAFCQRVEQGGYRSMIYGNKVDVARLNLDSLGQRPLWFAEYGATQPSARFDFAIWQYTNQGSVAGISTPVDLNLRFTDAI